MSRFVEVVEQHVEINKSGVRLPFGEQPAHAVVIQGFPEAKPFF